MAWRSLLPLCLAGCLHNAAQLSATDAAWLDVQAKYRADLDEAVAWAETPAEAWTMTADVVDHWAPAWWSLRAVYDSDGKPSVYCAARALWQSFGIVSPDLGCTLQRPCWPKPQNP